MAVVGEMHVGKGREEKEKRKGRGSEGMHLAREAAAVALEMRAACSSRVRRSACHTRDAASHTRVARRLARGKPSARELRAGWHAARAHRLARNCLARTCLPSHAAVRTLICWFSVIFSSTANFVSLSRKNL